MKKFVQIDGYGDQWFWVVESPSDIDVEFEDTLNDRLGTLVRNNLYTDSSKSSIRPDWLERVSAVYTNRLDLSSKFEKYKGPFLIRSIGSFMILQKNHIITNTVFSNLFPAANVSKESAVICENDYHPEKPWIEYLSKFIPENDIIVLNLFSNRDNLDIELNVKFITFYTTFTNFDWFERIVDTILKNKWTGKSIIGYCIDSKRWEQFPDELSAKVNKIKELGNTLTIVHDLAK